MSALVEEVALATVTRSEATPVVSEATLVVREATLVEEVALATVSRAKRRWSRKSFWRLSREQSDDGRGSRSGDCLETQRR
jgi:hypothetical protein